MAALEDTAGAQQGHLSVTTPLKVNQLKNVTSSHAVMKI